MEQDLKAEAARKGLTGDRADAYVYGTMRKTGWRPGVGPEPAKKKSKARVGDVFNDATEKK